MATVPEARELLLRVPLAAAAFACAAAAGAASGSSSKVPAIYVFGDSTADVGNNNYLPGSAVPRANFPHNGVDFPTARPTGRFSNGYNGVDFLGTGCDVAVGGCGKAAWPAELVARSGCGACGRLSTSQRTAHKGHPAHGHTGGVEQATRSSLQAGRSGAGYQQRPRQLQQQAGPSYEHGLQAQPPAVPRRGQQNQQAGLQRSPGSQLRLCRIGHSRHDRELHHPAEPAGRAVRHRAAQHLGVSTGGNYLFAFFARNSTPSDADKRRFVGNLVSLYQNHVKALYVLGARKFAVIDVPPIGCCPYPRSLHPLGACIDVLNELARGFNKGVRDAMRGLGSNFQALKYSVRSSHAVVQSIMKHPQRLGFKDTTNACCGSGRFNGKSWRTPNATLCGNRHEYLFWDLLHPTHAASKVAAAAIYNGSLHFAAPVNFRQLVEDQC